MAHAAAPTTEKDILGMTPGKFAMWAFLASDGMGFAGLFAMFTALRNKGIFTEAWDQGYKVVGELVPATWPNPVHELNISLTALNTFVLICSSVTMVKALSACRNDDRAGMIKFLAMTILGGAFFLGVQVYEYIHLVHDNIVPWTDNFCSTFYALTCYHGAHVFSGVVYLTCILIGTLRGKYHSKNYMPVEIVGLFWHFVDLVWILLFTFIYLLEPLPQA